MAGEVPEYPKNRSSHFAHKLVRLMVRTCAAQEMGPNACLLVVAIAHTEHAKWYTGPVTFWNDQLCSVLAFNSWGQLDRARKRAIATGWLHYKPGGKGKVGKYWTAIPAQFSGLPDGPVDEDFAFILSTGGEANGLSSPPVVKETGEKSVILSTSGERTEGQAGDKRGTNGEHSNLRPKPKPKPKEPPTPFEANEAKEAITPSGVPIPTSLDTPAFHQAWQNFIAHRKTLETLKPPKSPMTVRAAELALGKCERWGPVKAAQSIESSIISGWAGLFEPDRSKQTHGGTRDGRPYKAL